MDEKSLKTYKKKMAKLKGRAKQFADLDAPVSKGKFDYLQRTGCCGTALLIQSKFDPEEDGPAEENEDSDAGESDDGLAGTEHYGKLGTLFFLRWSKIS